MGADVLRESVFEDLTLIKRGKVRDVYDFGDHLLIVTSDRMSAFDVVMDDPIPNKGKILTQISLFGFDQHCLEHHFVGKSCLHGLAVSTKCSNWALVKASRTVSNAGLGPIWDLMPKVVFHAREELVSE